MTPPRRRADATENRSRIIDAAQALITRQDALRLNEVAKRAGVGQGTLYRHFPTREDLLAEVYRHDVDELVVAAPTLLAEHKPFEALALWFRRVADYARVKRGVFSAVTSGVQRDLSGHSLGPIGERSRRCSLRERRRHHRVRRRCPRRHPADRLSIAHRGGRGGRACSPCARAHPRRPASACR